MSAATEAMPKHPRPRRVGTLQSAARRLKVPDDAVCDPVARQRRLVADLCRMLDPQGHVRGANGHDHPAIPACADLSPRLAQTLDRLLAGDSEKEIAARLRRSPNTVHVYVKELYRRFEVNSRGELLARFVRAPGRGQREERIEDRG